MFNNLYGVSSCVWEQMDTGRHVYGDECCPKCDFEKLIKLTIVSIMLCQSNISYTGGVLSGKVGTGMCSPVRVFFRALRFCNGPFFI